VLLFALLIILPAIIVSAAALYSMARDRASAERALGDRLNGSAEQAGTDVLRELDQWEHELDGVSRAIENDLSASVVAVAPAPTGPGAASILTDRLKRALTTPGGGVLLWKDGDRVTVAPRGRVLYDLAPPHERFDGSRPTPVVPPDLVSAYRQCHVLEQAGSAERAAACGRTFYEALLDGRWLLERVRFEFYVAAARGWAGMLLTADQRSHLPAAARELSMRILTRQAEGLLATWPDSDDARLPRHRVLPSPDGVGLAFWRAAPGSERAVLVLPPGYVQSAVFPNALAAARRDHLDVTIATSGGDVVWSSTPPPSPTASLPTGTFTLADGTLAWRVRVWPQDPETWQGELRTRRALQATMLLLMLAAIAFAAVLAIRTLRRELAVARREAEFVSAITHEFRSPIAGIRQLGALLEQGRIPSDERRQQYYGMIVKESERLERLVDNVLDSARLEDGTRPFQLELVDPGPWLAELAAAFSAGRRDDTPELQVSVADDLPAIRADTEALALAAQNLLDNAAKYSPGRPAIWLDARREGRDFVIEVRDRGAGISTEDLPHVFERFYRGRGDVTRRVKGTGLGLSLVKHVVSAHHGTVAVESQTGVGSTFTIRLPGL
jgi:signal transduction histidine kinase